jgi:hypothetical protein
MTQDFFWVCVLGKRQTRLGLVFAISDVKITAVARLISISPELYSETGDDSDVTNV